MSKKILFSGILLLLILGATGFVYWNGSAVEKDDGTVLIGIINGDIERHHFMKGALLEIERINAENGLNGRKIKSHIRENVVSIRDGKLAVNDLVAVGCQSIIMSADWDVSSHSLPLLEYLKVVTIFVNLPQSEINKSTEYKMSFSTQPELDSYIDPLIDYLKKNNLKKIVIAYPEDLFISKKIANCFEQKGYIAGISVISRGSYRTDYPMDFLLQSLKRARSKLEFDAALFLDEPSQIIKLLEVINLGKASRPILTSSDMTANLNNPALQNLQVPFIYCTYSADSRNTAKRLEFEKAYIAKYNAIPNRAAYQGGEAVYKLFEAMKKKNSSHPSDVADALKSMNKQYHHNASFADLNLVKKHDYVAVSVMPKDTAVKSKDVK